MFRCSFPAICRTKKPDSSIVVTLARKVLVTYPCPVRFHSRTEHQQKFILPGGHSRGVPPVPIPNTEVKPLRADGTAS